MAENSKIEWTDATWNPIVGCSVKSPGCTNCYAMPMAARIERMGTAPHYAGTTTTSKAGPVYNGHVARAPDSILSKPLHWRKPRRIFVNSMGDLFHENVPDDWIARVFAVMALAPQHTFQVLTKRADRMREYVNSDRAWANLEHEIHRTIAKQDVRTRLFQTVEHPLPNVWLGVSVEDQRRADERIPDLLATPAAVRFVSIEPLLGPIDLTRYMWPVHPRWPAGYGSAEKAKEAGAEVTYHRQGLVSARRVFLDWIIAGGESGPGARPMHPDWARGARDACVRAGVPFLFKQWGEYRPTEPGETWVPKVLGGNGAIFTQDGQTMARVGKKHAGRLLDGREWNEVPHA